MKDIVLYGHSGSGNHGCEAIVRSTRAILGYDYTVFSNSPEQDYNYGIIENVDRLTNDIRKNSIRRYFYAVYCRIFRNSMMRYKYAYKPFLEKVQAGKIYLSVGGDHYCYGSYSNHIYDFLNEYIKGKGAKSVLWSCSIEGNDLDNQTIESLKKYDLITVRESLTYEALKLHGISKNVVILPDVAFQLIPEKTDLPAIFSHGSVVGINVSPMVQKYGVSSEVVLRNYERLVAYILENTECSVALIPHVVWSDTDDRKPLGVLYDKFMNTGRIALINDQPAMKLKYIISKCCFFVGARTHTTIAAYSTCVPTLVVGYSIKARGIAKDIFGTENGYVIRVQEMKEERKLTEAFIALWSKRGEIADLLNKIIPEYNERCLLAKQYIDRLL